MAQETKKVAIYTLENHDEFVKLAVGIEDENPELAIKLFKVLRQVQIQDITFNTVEASTQE